MPSNLKPTEALVELKGGKIVPDVFGMVAADTPGWPRTRRVVILDAARYEELIERERLHSSRAGWLKGENDGGIR